MFVTKRNNEIESVKFDKITERISKLINEGENLDPVLIAQKVVASIFPGISTEELDLESANICVNLSTTNYLYSNLAGRILVSNLHKKLFNLKDNQDFPTNFVDKQNLIQSKLNLLDITYLEYINNNKDDINNIIDYNRDYLFDYFGFKTLEKAYLMKIGNKIIETPQDMFLRVACFINMNNIEQIKKTYDLMSNGFYTHASPTLFNAGNKRSQLASCFLLGTEDSIEGITKTWASVSKISKWGGGIGLHVSNIRAKNSLIRGTNGPSNGLIPMLKVYNEIARYIDQGGKRKGSIAIYLEPHHPDIMAFLDLRKNFGTETERARDLFTAVWVSDLFMTLVHEDKDWYLLCPDACPGLSDAYGKKYEELYWSYVYQKKYNSKIKAREVMKAILDSQLETGTPYIGYKDHINRKSNQKNIGTIKSSNLCHEIVQYSSENEYAVCNLASIAINKCVENKNIEGSWTIYVKDNCKYCTWAKKYLESKGYTYNIKTNLNELQISDKNKLTYPQIFLDNEYIGGWNELFNYIKCSFNYNKLYEVAYQATKNLNNIIDLNYYPIIEAKISNIRHRPIGLGIQGLADTLVLLKTPFDSEEAIDFNSKMMETIYLAALTASKDISKERMEDMKLLIKQFYFDSEINFPEFYDPNYDKNNILYHKIKPSIYELQSNDSENFPSYCGAYSTFKGSPISQGKFQFDLWMDTENQINSESEIKLNYPEKWEELREEIKIYGVRNSLVTALMPTASTSQILGNTECFEFFTNNIYTRKTLAGDFPLVNKYLINDLKDIGLWSDEMKQLILANNGSIANFSNIPEQIRRLYQTIWEIKQKWVLKAAVARGPFVDQTQSMNIFYGVPDYQKLYASHMWSWRNGLKTGIYYLRSRPSKDATKVTIDPTIQSKLRLIVEENNTCESCSA